MTEVLSRYVTYGYVYATVAKVATSLSRAVRVSEPGWFYTESSQFSALVLALINELKIRRLRRTSRNSVDYPTFIVTSNEFKLSGSSQNRERSSFPEIAPRPLIMVGKLSPDKIPEFS